MANIHLQGIGKFQAKPAKDLKIGHDILVWNYGLTSTPIKLLKETKNTLLFLTISDGQEFERRFNKNRLVAYMEAKQ